MNKLTFKVPLKKVVDESEQPSSSSTPSVMSQPGESIVSSAGSEKSKQNKSVPPVKPESSFMLFVADQRKNLVKKGFEEAEATLEAAKLWQTASCKVKKTYDDRRTKALIKYEARLVKYNELIIKQKKSG